MKYIKISNYEILTVGEEKLLIPLNNSENNKSEKNDIAAIVINEVGGDILELIENNLTLDEIIDEILKIYDVEYNILKEDVDNFINKLIEYNVITTDNSQ